MRKEYKIRNLFLYKRIYHIIRICLNFVRIGFEDFFVFMKRIIGYPANENGKTVRKKMQEYPDFPSEI